MRLYVETMDAVVAEFTLDGRVLLEHEGWMTPSLQETRAIIHAAQAEVAVLTELIEALDRSAAGRG